MTSLQDLRFSTLDPFTTLESLFPDEHALQEAQNVQSRIQGQLSETREQIHVLRKALEDEQSSSNRIQTIQELIVELLERTTSLQGKALESEAIVKDITRDIQRLDRAKKNLMESIVVLKRLQMLVNALAQLEYLIPSRRYRDIAHSLSAVKQLSLSFKSYTTVQRVASLYKQVQEAQGSCRVLVAEEFETFFVPDPSKPPVSPATLGDCCLIVDSLGDDVRNQMLDRYAALELKEYRRVFRSTDEAGQLDNTARRYAWFRRILKSHDEEREGIFPPSWKVGLYLVARFAEVTSQDLSNVLAKVKPLTVTLLLESLQATLDFESQMAKKYGLPFKEIVLTALPSTSYAAPFTPISTVFDPFLIVFVEAQDKAISDMLSIARSRRSSLETPSSAEGETSSVLPSSTDLFYFYGQTMEQCAKLSRGTPLRELAKVFKKWLKVYAESILISSLKKQQEPTSRRSTERRSIEGRPNIQEMKNACLVLNTADYCHTTASQLEDKLKDAVLPEYRDEISFQPELDLFIGVISSALLVLLRELETTCEPAFTAISRTPWANFENVSGPSMYVGDIVRGLSTIGETVKEGLDQKKYMRNFCDKAVGVVISRLTQTVVRSRPLKKVGAEQLLLDLSEIKKSFIDLPHFSRDDTRSITSYHKHVHSSTQNFETILKVILAPEDPPEGFVQNYSLLVGDRSFSNFQKILDLKGTPRKDQNSLLDIFIAVTSTLDNLSDSSFLSALDMDMTTPIQSIVLANASPSERALLSPISSTVAMQQSYSDEGNGNVASPTNSKQPFAGFRQFFGAGPSRTNTLF